MIDELELIDEWDAALRRLQHCSAADLAHGVQVFRIPASVFRHNLVGLASVIVDGEQYQPHETGVPAFITPAFEGDRLIDLVAWHPASPDRWALRYGVADRLGEPEWETCRVWRSVFNWLRAGADGIVPLRPSALHWIDSETLIAEDNEHRRTLIRDLMKPRDLPRIVTS